MKRNLAVLFVVTILGFMLSEPVAAQTEPVFVEDCEGVPPVGELPAGWVDAPQLETDNMSKWSLFRGGFESTYCLEWSSEYMGPAPWSLLTTPEIASAKGYAVSFDYQINGGYLALYVSFDGGLTVEEEPLFSFSESTDGWEHAVVALPIAAGGRLALCFAAGNADAAHPV